jgi:hypothetical protein
VIGEAGLEWRWSRREHRRCPAEAHASVSAALRWRRDHSYVGMSGERAGSAAAALEVAVLPPAGLGGDHPIRGGGVPSIATRRPVARPDGPRRGWRGRGPWIHFRQFGPQETGQRGQRLIPMAMAAMRLITPASRRMAARAAVPRLATRNMPATNTVPDRAEHAIVKSPRKCLNGSAAAWR